VISIRFPVGDVSSRGKVSISRVVELTKIGVLWPNLRIIAICTFGAGRGTPPLSPPRCNIQ